ncbi:hypothetical protein LIR45_01305 [Lachnospiraceae bacterium EP-SM-12S-S03]|nr:hypothetical protein [Lachnospiraceae bacterium EP-SM-12S-S03]
MIIKLNNAMSKLLLEEVENVSTLVKSQKNIDSNMIELEISDIKELQFLINDEIVYRGLDNQETVNDFGKKLYALYDEILYQKHDN